MKNKKGANFMKFTITNLTLINAAWELLRELPSDYLALDMLDVASEKELAGYVLWVSEMPSELRFFGPNKYWEDLDIFEKASLIERGVKKYEN
tara:strand:+ start:80 stop:358 length:279 start_codon:yes stop_codon:yes gene_type:complete